MIQHARRRAISERLQFVEADLRSWHAPQPLDVILSSSCLYWISDHASLLDHLVRQVALPGVLAIQMPNNFDAPSHTLLAMLRAQEPWASRLADVPTAAIEKPEWYISQLADRGFTVDVWETTYYHLLEAENPVLQWVMGTTLRPILAPLTEAEQASFLEEYGGLLARAYPERSFGTVFPFRRLFVVAHKC